MAKTTADIAADEVEQSELVDMKRTKKDKKSENEAAPPTGEDDYPYGLSLSVDDDELTKLGIKTLPGVGDEVKITARAKVRSVSQNAREGDEDSRSVSYQITRLKIG